MTKPKSDSSFSDDMARLYESTLVPLIFEPYADDLAARARASLASVRLVAAQRVVPACDGG